jgi:hypothetical protein
VHHPTTTHRYAGRDWDAVARDYAARTLTVGEIVALYAVSQSALYRRLHRDGWILRMSGAADASPKSRSLSGAPACASNSSDDACPRTSSGCMHPPQRSTTPDGDSRAHRQRRPRRGDFVRRLTRALDRKITDFEARHADASPASAADAERDARTLNTLVRLYDKLRSAAKAAASTGPQGTGCGAALAGAPAAKDIDDPDGLRRELARRLEKLRLGDCR